MARDTEYHNQCSSEFEPGCIIPTKLSQVGQVFILFYLLPRLGGCCAQKLREGM
jgi:hypothetical protein